MRENRTAGSARGDGPKKLRRIGEGTAVKAVDQQRGSAKATVSRPVPTHHRISHAWLLANVPMDKAILRKWLAAGYVEATVLYPTEEGTPQGGIISPVLANLTLDGLERVAHAAAPGRLGRSQVNVVRYADDFSSRLGRPSS